MLVIDRGIGSASLFRRHVTQRMVCISSRCELVSFVSSVNRLDLIVNDSLYWLNSLYVLKQCNLG